MQFACDYASQSGFAGTRWAPENKGRKGGGVVGVDDLGHKAVWPNQMTLANKVGKRLGTKKVSQRFVHSNSLPQTRTKTENRYGAN